MCLLIVEVLFFVAGAYMILLGKIPQDIFGILFGRKHLYEMESAKTKAFGLLLAFPLPLVFLSGLALRTLGNEDSSLILVILEPIIVIIVAIIAIAIARSSRTPKPEGQ